MKKIKILMLSALLFIVALTPAFSSNVSVDFGFDGNATFMSMDFKAEDSSFKTDFNANMNMYVDILFKRNTGLNIIFGTDFSSVVKVGAGLAYSTPISSTTDFRLAVGPYFEFLNNFSMGLYSRFDFDFNLSRSVYLSVGTNIDMEFLRVENSKAYGLFETTLIIPRFGVGFNF